MAFHPRTPFGPFLNMIFLLGIHKFPLSASADATLKSPLQHRAFRFIYRQFPQKNSKERVIHGSEDLQCSIRNPSSPNIARVVEVDLFDFHQQISPGGFF